MFGKSSPAGMSRGSLMVYKLVITNYKVKVTLTNGNARTNLYDAA